MFAIILFYACRKFTNTEDMFTNRLIYTCRKFTDAEVFYVC